jgi:hypothetical protein
MIQFETKKSAPIMSDGATSASARKPKLTAGAAERPGLKVGPSLRQEETTDVSEPSGPDIRTPTDEDARP